MALQKNYVISAFGKDLVFSNAYIQITQMFGDKNNLLLQITVFGDSNKSDIVDQLSYQFTPSVNDKSFNFYKQGYDYLKTLDEFKDATDVLEDGQTA